MNGDTLKWISYLCFLFSALCFVAAGAYLALQNKRHRERLEAAYGSRCVALARQAEKEQASAGSRRKRSGNAQAANNAANAQAAADNAGRNATEGGEKIAKGE